MNFKRIRLFGVLLVALLLVSVYGYGAVGFGDESTSEDSHLDELLEMVDDEDAENLILQVYEMREKGMSFDEMMEVLDPDFDPSDTSFVRIPRVVPTDTKGFVIPPEEER